MVVKLRTAVEARAEITLSETEILAIDALAGYGIDSFLKCFYAGLGTSYLQPYEAGLRSFFEKVSGIRSICNNAEECRKFLSGAARELTGGEA